MSVNFRDLLSIDTPKWIAKNMNPEESGKITKDFWILPMDENEPTYKETVDNSLKLIKTTRIKNKKDHDSLIFIELNDEEGGKFCVSDTVSMLPEISDLDYIEYFDLGCLDFLQKLYISTHCNLPTRSRIPVSVVGSLPVFSDDIKPFLPEIYVFIENKSELIDSMEIKSVKALLIIERNQLYVQNFKDLILDVAYQIPAEGHQWIFDQLLSAIRSNRLISFYLELYRIFEFFFPIDFIFRLADRLSYTDSELLLLTHCRETLNWNTNHHTGARSAIKYATIAFAEKCLNESFSGQSNEEQFRGRALEKLTNARHLLTHQGFRSISLSRDDLLRLTESLLILLYDAFKEYSKILASRKIKQ